MAPIEKMTVARFGGLPAKMEPRLFHVCKKADIAKVNKVLSLDPLYDMQGVGMPGSLHTALNGLVLFQMTEADQESYKKYSTKIKLVETTYGGVVHSIANGGSIKIMRSNISRDIDMFISRQEYHGKGSTFDVRNSEVVAFRNLRYNPESLLKMLVRVSAAYMFLQMNIGQVLNESREIVNGNDERLASLLAENHDGIVDMFNRSLFMSKTRDYANIRKEWLAGDFDLKASLNIK
jgi:hypothetical protein